MCLITAISLLADREVNSRLSEKILKYEWLAYLRIYRENLPFQDADLYITDFVSVPISKTGVKRVAVRWKQIPDILSIARIT